MNHQSTKHQTKAASGLLQTQLNLLKTQKKVSQKPNVKKPNNQFRSSKSKNYLLSFLINLEMVSVKATAPDKTPFVCTHQKSITLPQKLVQKIQIGKSHKPKISVKSSDKDKKESDKNLSNKLTHQKFHHSNLKDLKRTIVIDSFGNNNLNVPRKKMKSNITKMNRFLMEILPQTTDPNGNNSSLFEESTSTLKEGEDSRDVNATMPNFIIFDEKQRNEIDAISFLPDVEGEEEGEEEDDDQKEDDKIVDTSLIDIDQDLGIQPENKNINISLEDIKEV